MTDFAHPEGASQLNGHANPWDLHNAKIEAGHRFRESIKHDLGVIDPWDQFDKAPEYHFGQLPKIYEDYIKDNISEYGGDPAAYACAFLSTMCGVLHTSVEMQTRPHRDNWKAPNEHSLTLGKSGSNKSGMYKDLTRYQNQWQEVLLKASPGKKKNHRPPQIILQNGSVEGVLHQCADNNGERLIIANDEAMSFFMGAGSHHRDDSTSIMTDLVCKLYDGEPYYKRLVRESYAIPRALGTLIMSTVIDKFNGWEDFAHMINSGAMARMSVGIISRPSRRDPAQHVAGADKAMGDMLFRLRALRDVRFTLEEAAHNAWSGYIDDCEERNAAMVDASSGFIEWCRKYDTRVMSMASIFQAIDFSSGNMLNYEPFDIKKTIEDDDKIGGGEPRQGKLVRISYENLARAIAFVDGFLLNTQEYFYRIAEGASEFGPEIKNWVARRMTTHTPDDPEGNILTRTDLIHRGPACVRPKNGVTEAWKAKADRWVRALIDHGYIEVYRPDNARRFNTYRTEEQEANFKIRNEFFLKFANDRAKLMQWDAVQQERAVAIKKGIKLGPKSAHHGADLVNK